MGAGIYLVWPAFYTDVTDAYRLDRRGRLRTDLGGVYFNAVFVLATFAAWAATGAEVFLLFVPLQLFQMLHQLLPVVRMDGYYILSDLTGVPDLFTRIKPTLESAIPGRGTDARAAPLKRWVRVTVTAWVIVVVPLLLASVLLAVIALPRVAATAWDSLGLQWDALGQQAAAGRWLGVATAVIAVLALVLPLASTAYLLARIGRRVVMRGWTTTSGRPVWRGAAIAGAVAVVAGLGWLWWPNGEYEPIGRDEKGTLTDGISAARNLATGRPGMTGDVGLEPGVLPLDPTDPLRREDVEADEAPAPATTVDAPRPTTTVRRTAPTTVRAPTTVPSAPASDDAGEPTP